MEPDQSVMFSKPETGQQGIALITVLMILVFISVFTIGITERQDLSMRRVSNMMEGEQTFQIAIGAEQWAIKLLEKDIFTDLNNQNSVNIDHTQEAWANLGPAVKVEGTESVMLMRILDQHGKLNINNLVQGRPKSGQVKKKLHWYSIFRSLFSKLDIDPELVDAVVDWVDADDEITGSYGAESSYYESQSPAYFSPNKPMTTLSELIQIKGFKPSIVEALLPYITVLPLENVSNLTKVNVNTASVQVLNTLTTDLSGTIESFEFFIDSRQQNPYDSISDFIADFASQTGLTLISGITEFLDVRSDYFIGHSCARTGNVKLSQFSLLRKDRENEQVKVIYRYRQPGCADLEVPNTAESDS